MNNELKRMQIRLLRLERIELELASNTGYNEVYRSKRSGEASGMCTARQMIENLLRKVGEEVM